MADRPTSWRKSRQCESHACVEVAVGAGRVAVRSSAAPEGPVVEFTAAAWRNFCTGLKAGDLTC
ncbi:DUF397 domain-containing protein [Phytohabitans rumicis]|uniref:DUF397 domain-containing protein n=1 Tax=Phytohabitans rumicis TaxID=1076125 RepID=UPI001564809D|nr:DUF397 domain-containing protein [Phytohabitans rumicis]